MTDNQSGWDVRAHERRSGENAGGIGAIEAYNLIEALKEIHRRESYAAQRGLVDKDKV